jgi:DNA-binding transcriptional regulator YiaG
LPFVPVRLKSLNAQEPLPAPTTLGEHIKKRRLEWKLTLRKVGALLGADEWSVINWEKGRTVPKVYRLPSIIRFLGYNPLPQPRTIGEALVAKRLERGWSRKVASRHLSIDESTLRDWSKEKLFSFASTGGLSQKYWGFHKGRSTMK